MARTVNTPPYLPNPNVNGGQQIVGTVAAGDKGRSWEHLQRCVNSLYAHKWPCLVVDTHGAEEKWLGHGYPVGSSYKHFYKFPYPLSGLTPWLNGQIGVYLRGERNKEYLGAATSWQVNVLNAEDGSRNTLEVAGGSAGGSFLWHVGDFECIPGGSGDYGELDLYLETFGGSLGSDNYITSILIQPKIVLSGSELPAGMWGVPDTYPLFALDPALWGAAGDSAHAGMIATAGALLESIYRRRQPIFMSSSRSYAGGLEQLILAPTSSWAVLAKLRASELPAGSPGVSFLIYVEDSKVTGDGELRLTAGANQTTIPNASLSSGAWTSVAALNCEAGDVVTVEGHNIRLGTVMIFAREATLP